MSTSSSLTASLLAQLPDASPQRGVEAGLEASLRQWLGEAAAAWPGVLLDDEVVLAYVAARLENPHDLTRSLAAVDWPELYLACACGRGDARALRAFDERYLRGVPAAIAHLGLGKSDVEEILQEIREKLFVVGAEGASRLADEGAAPGAAGGARIDTYAGGGRLQGLVRVMATRAAISIKRRQKREVHDPADELLRLPSVGADPELESVKHELREHFAQAFEQAVAALTPRERNLLRMHLLDGVTLDQLATSYGVHRVTITRWLVKARRSLLTGTRRQLETQLGGPAGKLDSFVGLVQSRLDLSFRRLLQSK